MRRFSSEGIEVNRIPWSVAAWWLIFFVSIIYLFSVRWSGDNWKRIVDSDGHGYYAYLPAVFVQHDYQFNFADEVECKYRGLYCGTDGRFYCNDFGDKKVDKYFAGTAVALVPFYLPAYGLSDWLGYDHDGYSLLYQCSVSIGALFYLLLGLWYLRKLLRLYKVGEKASGIVLLTLFFGTNLFYYSLVEASLSHVYSFGFITVFLYHAHRLFENYSNRRLLLIAFLFGMIVLIRPVNGLVILALPLAAGSWSNLRSLFTSLWKSKVAMLFSLLIFAAIIFIQAILYYKQCGHWWVYSYTNERLIFNRPEIINFLFSFRKGLLVYTPVLLLMLFGLLPLRRERFRMVSYLLFLVVVIYILSCWWMWYYGGSYGMRAIIEYFAFFGLLFGVLLERLQRNWKMIFNALAVFIVLPLIYVNLVQTWQYYEGILPYDGMTKEKYAHIFMQTGRQFFFIYPPEGRTWNVAPVNKVIAAETNDFEGNVTWPFSDNVIVSPQHTSGTHALRLEKGKNNSPAFTRTVSSLVPDSLSGKAWARVTFKLWLDKNNTDLQLVVSQYGDHGDSYGWFAPSVIQVTDKEKQWVQLRFDTPVFPARSADDKLSIYFLKTDKSVVYIDDVEVQILAP